MNDQRREVYAQRRAFMQAPEVAETVAEMRRECIETMVSAAIPENAYPENWDVAELEAKVRDQLGLARIRRAYTGGAPLGPDVFRFFHAIGVNLKQLYGQTEICGIAVVHRDDAISFNTVGSPIPGTDLRINDDGEIPAKNGAPVRLRTETSTGFRNLKWLERIEVVNRYDIIGEGRGGYFEDADFYDRNQLI